MFKYTLIECYYKIRPYLPRRLQVYVRRIFILGVRKSKSNIWPIDERASERPHKWCGWPEGKRFALVLTHDVESAIGHDKCLELMRMEKELNFRSSFNFVPKRYNVSADLRNCLTRNGFEVGVHGLYHDGKLFESRKIFLERSIEINRYLNEWKAVGFRAPSMHRKLQWIHDLDIEYDASTFDTDPFEPQPEGVTTIFPFWVQDDAGRNGYVELPYTLPQDFTLFVLMRERSIEIWKRKLDWIVRNGGMVLLNVHPDYMNFDGKLREEEYPSSYYSELLEYIKSQYEGQYWHVLPKHMARIIKNNCSGSP